MHHYKTFRGGPLFFGGTPIIQGGMSQAEMTAMLERQALDNDRMLANAADEAEALERRLADKDREMEQFMEQQQRSQEIDLANAQKALGVELDSQTDATEADDLKADFSKLQAALSSGLGRGSNTTNARPL